MPRHVCIPQVDIYGNCGEPCNGECFTGLRKQYKFYLAFENSVCAEYVTEKFFNALADGLVPVFLGK